MKKALLASLAFLVLLAVAWGIQLWRHPLDAIAQGRRRTLVGAGFEERELPALQLHYFVAGQGRPLIFLHGTGDQAGSWAEVAPTLTAQYRVIAVDLPGHGASAPASGDLPMATVVKGAEAVLAEVATPEAPAIVVGNSLGAWLATLLAHRHPALVSRLVLVNGGALLGEPGAPSLQPKTREEAAHLMSQLRDPSAPAIPGFVLDDVVRRAAEGPIARLSRDGAGLVAHLLDGRLGEIATPVDLLWGASDQLMKLTYAERLQRAFPASRLTRVERCGHIPQVECPRLFAERLAEVLASAPPTAPLPAPGDATHPISSPE